MMEKTRVQFQVRVLRLKLWEKMFACGSDMALGEWDPLKAFPLTKSLTDSDVWTGCAEISDPANELKFRYLIGYYLDPCTENSKELLIVHKWESFLVPRSITPLPGQKLVLDDTFGNYSGSTLLTDGWIIHNEENVVLLRIHGEALKFYKASHRGKEHRVKIVPFDVRFKEIFSYEDRHTRKGMLWRASSVYQNTIESVDDDCPHDPDPVLPEVPSFSNTQLSVLSREDPIFGQQYINGSVFRNDVDYLVFKTRTVSLEHLAFRIELFTGMDRIGIAYALPAALPDLYGKATFPIISLKNIPIGQIDIDYMLVKNMPMNRSVRDSMAVSWGRYWKKRNTLEVGHRGMGCSYTKMATARENTIHSLSEAAKKGADYVEFDVQLTKDMQPVIYHDFHVLVEVAGRKRDLFHAKPRLHQLAIKDLSLDQLQLLQLEHPAERLHKTWRVTPTEEEVNEEIHSPFPHLKQVLESVNPDVGFNIEVKYPMKMKDGTHECPAYIERNEFVDVILRNVLEHAGRRRVIFSSFDPDVCSLITLKQHVYPVMFLVVGPTTRYTPFQDIRSDCSKIAVNYAAGNGLLGVNFHSEELLQDASPLKRAEKFNLVTFVWGDDLNLIKNLEYFRGLQVDGVIYDRIGEMRPRRNTFVVENESRTALPIRTPECSRSPTPEPDPSSRVTIQPSLEPLPIVNDKMKHLSISKNSAFSKLNEEESSQTSCIHNSTQNYCSLCT
ncbi:Pyruvate dehydrogenase E1 component subunit alpha [Trichostrongylus colubriformis]|uniref:Pyruvate dehydrogenase E1 component subunit alpha n=1 Tax=Trichostrongylus colubriformis TaxID=6319 RepID=A0AAN8IN88_TRICO